MKSCDEKRLKCYNSGPISGLSYLGAYNRFEKADSFIREALGMEPVNPMKSGLPAAAPWIVHMAYDILLLLPCPVVFFQEGWGNSKGSRIEYKIASWMRKQIIFE